MPALVERLATDAGEERVMISLQQAAAVYWTIMSPEWSPGTGERWGLIGFSESDAARM